ncbi:hypothetical protein GGS21DRAFT_524134 [Xylaria nigripes]|nr:hypothetical protein GGS21DRAFT_524134 [Xylaria nigripes]
MFCTYYAPTRWNQLASTCPVDDSYIRNTPYVARLRKQLSVQPNQTRHRTMSQKINSKNLTYDNSLPPFLARLHGQRTAQTGPDPILASHRRPGQKRSASEEAEDAPLVVDEDGNAVDLSTGPDGEAEAVEARGKVEEQAELPTEGDSAAEAQETQKEKVAGIGATRKRKVGRVIGEERSDDEESAKRGRRNADNDKARIAKASADVRRLLGEDAASDGSKGAKVKDDSGRKSEGGSRVKSAKKKTAKKIKLSFGDNDDNGD